MKYLPAAIFLFLHISSAIATELPGYDPLERVIPNVTSAFEAEIISVSIDTTASDRVLRLIVKPKEAIFGYMPTEDEFQCIYKEFLIPDIPPGMHLSFVNYTGSGIEFQAEVGESYIFLIGPDLETSENNLVLRMELPHTKEQIFMIYQQHEELI